MIKIHRFWYNKDFTYGWEYIGEGWKAVSDPFKNEQECIESAKKFAERFKS